MTYLIAAHHHVLHALLHALTARAFDREAFTHLLLQLSRISIGLAVISVVVQVAYPSDRALPFSSIAGTETSLKPVSELEAMVRERERTAFKIEGARTSYEVTLPDLGISFDRDATVSQVRQYPLAQKLIPFSLLRGTQADIVTRVDEQKLTAFAEKVVAENNKVPVEGSLAVVGGDVVVNKPEIGASYSVEEVAGLLRGLGGTVPTAMVLPVKHKSAVFTEAQLERAAAEARGLMSKAVTVEAVGKQITIEPQTIASWVQFDPQEQSGTIQVVFDRAAIQQSLQPLAGQVYIAPIATVVSTLDGAETGRVPGALGRALAEEQAIDAVTEGLRAGATAIAVATAEVAHGQRLERHYSATSTGLQLLVNDWAADTGGQWGIDVRELGGRQRSAAYRAQERFASASVYKLFLSYSVFGALSSGALQADQATSTGKTVDECIELMMVLSNNACPQALGGMIGWDNAHGDVQARGFTGTNLSYNASFTTTPADTSSFLVQLHQGGLASPEHTDRLLGMMKRQIYRSGIPAGSRGTVVANKVGYVSGYRHDVGIVYHPSGTYVLSVMSQGGTYAQIAQLSQKLHAYMHQ